MYDDIDDGVWSVKHTFIEDEIRSGPEFIFSPDIFELYPPLEIEDSAEITKLINPEPGSAPRGFTKPPKLPIFTHFAFYVTAEVLQFFCISGYVLGPQALYNDYPDTFHQCRIGNWRRANDYLVFHHCGNLCCCQEDYPDVVLAARCGLLRRQRKRVILKVGSSFSTLDRCYVPRRYVLGHPGNRLMWFQLPRLSDFQQTSNGQNPYFETLGLLNYNEACFAERIKRTAFQAYLDRYPNGSLDGDRTISLCSVKHFMGKPGEFHPIPILSHDQSAKLPSRRSKRTPHLVKDSVFKDYRTREIDLDHTGGLFSLLWDIHEFPCLNELHLKSSNDIPSGPTDHNYQKPSKTRLFLGNRRLTVKAHQVVQSHQCHLQNLFPGSIVHCDCPALSDFHKFLDQNVKTNLAVKATSGDTCGDPVDDGIEINNSKWRTIKPKPSVNRKVDRHVVGCGNRPKCQLVTHKEPVEVTLAQLYPSVTVANSIAKVCRKPKTAPQKSARFEYNMKPDSTTLACKVLSKGYRFEPSSESISVSKNNTAIRLIKLKKPHSSANASESSLKQYHNKTGCDAVLDPTFFDIPPVEYGTLHDCILFDETTGLDSQPQQELPVTDLSKPAIDRAQSASSEIQTRTQKFPSKAPLTTRQTRLRSFKKREPRACRKEKSKALSSK